MGWAVSVGDGAVLALMMLFIALCPYTKVEESFNMQAMHDVLQHGANISMYDHNVFPGVVPRTFVGAAVVSSAVYPLHAAINSLQGDDHLVFVSQYMCRLALGLGFWLAYRELRKAVCATFGPRAGGLLGALSCLQFHLLYYCSRPLPNTFALILVTWGYSMWLKGAGRSALYAVAAAMVLVRCDMVLLLAPMALQMLLFREVQFIPIVLSGLSVSLLMLGISVAFDSYFWGRWLYPEGEVLFFNTVQNKSSEWGVSPWHWYFTSALPKGLLVTLPLSVAGIIGLRYPLQIAKMDEPPRSVLAILGSASVFSSSQLSSDEDLRRENQMHILCHKKIVYFVSPAVVFCFLYSFLPHKELRFILPVFPVFTMAAAAAASNLFPSPALMDSRSEEYGSSRARRLKLYGTGIRICAGLVIVGSAALISLFTLASMYNYPGAAALHSVHRSIQRHYGDSVILPSECETVLARPIRVHIDVLACVAGVTRFLQRQSLPGLCVRNRNQTDAKWAVIEYSKEESLSTNDLSAFDWIIAPHSDRITLAKIGFLAMEEVSAFSRFEVDFRNLKSLRIPLELKLSPILVVMRNMKPQTAVS